MASLSDTLSKVNSNDFEIIVYGLGYVGLPLSLRLAAHGFTVIGVDTDARKIDSLKKIIRVKSYGIRANAKRNNF